jgi:hypothetical protein
VQRSDHVHALDDAPKRGEAEAVGIAAAAEVELGLVADADEVLGGRGAGLRARHRDGAVEMAQPGLPRRLVGDRRQRRRPDRRAGSFPMNDLDLVARLGAWLASVTTR